MSDDVTVGTGLYFACRNEGISRRVSAKKYMTEQNNVRTPRQAAKQQG
jgi:hypothetical protein